MLEGDFLSKSTVISNSHIIISHKAAEIMDHFSQFPLCLFSWEGMPGGGHEDWVFLSSPSHPSLLWQPRAHQDAENSKTFCHMKRPGTDPSQNSLGGEEPGTTHQPQGLFWWSKVMDVGYGCWRGRGEWCEDHGRGAVPSVEGKGPAALKHHPLREVNFSAGLTLHEQTKGHSPAQTHSSFPSEDIFLLTFQLPQCNTIHLC